jgi:hypothetical protein
MATGTKVRIISMQNRTLSMSSPFQLAIDFDCVKAGNTDAAHFCNYRFRIVKHYNRKASKLTQIPQPLNLAAL